jgi:hypothetical protein
VLSVCPPALWRWFWEVGPGGVGEDLGSSDKFGDEGAASVGEMVGEFLG